MLEENSPLMNVESLLSNNEFSLLLPGKNTF